jgi:hypothetical protein
MPVYQDVINPLFVTNKSVTCLYHDQSVTLLFGLQNANTFGGTQFNKAGNYISSMHPGINSTGMPAEGTEYVCPLQGDGNAG